MAKWSEISTKQGLNRWFLWVGVGMALLALGSCGGFSSFRGRGGIGGVYDVRAFGAKGDGKTLDTPSVNSAIDAASANGGGTIRFPAGTYLCYSIHLKSNITLDLNAGATILAAATPKDGRGYDPAEANPWNPYQDFGHSHWHNSLIWGEGIENVSIQGSGLIDGRGLSNGQNYPSFWPVTRPTSNPTTTFAETPPWRETRYLYPPTDTLADGVGNKAIALKLCRNVTLRDFAILEGGHFGILATGVDNFTLDNLKIDTNRDGMDVDACRNVRISNCTVNSPWDDGICLKSSLALGFARATENVTITNCQVCGYEIGSLLDGSCVPLEGSPTGRIKFGTESNGGFRNITITNCVFDNCRGLALETVDGGPLEDVTISSITMRHVVNSPIFLRLGGRMRAPPDAPDSVLRRINISNVVIYDADRHFSSIISGIPGQNIEDVKLRNIQVYCLGGGTAQWATTQPAEKVADYPEPSMFGETPAYGFFIRHVKGIELSNIDLHYRYCEARAPIVMTSVNEARLDHVDAESDFAQAILILHQVDDLTLEKCGRLADKRIPSVDEAELGAEGASATNPAEE